MNIWFTSDQHYFHKNVIKYCNRPYESLEEMNVALVDNWNSVVDKNDVVYCLGDLSLAFRPVEIFTPMLNGRKTLVPGNHDLCHPYHKKSRNPERREVWTKKYEDCGWEVVDIHHEIEIDGETVLMCHHPYKGDVPHDENSNEKSAKDKYWNYRLEDCGEWLICGHVHEKWQTKGNMINVGVDVWDFTPVHIDEIRKIMREV